MRHLWQVVSKNELFEATHDSNSFHQFASFALALNPICHIHQGYPLRKFKKNLAMHDDWWQLKQIPKYIPKVEFVIFYV